MTEYFRAILPPNAMPPRSSQMTTARLMLLTGVLAGPYSSWNIGVSLFHSRGGRPEHGDPRAEHWERDGHRDRLASQCSIIPEAAGDFTMGDEKLMV